MGTDIFKAVFFPTQILTTFTCSMASSFRTQRYSGLCFEKCASLSHKLAVATAEHFKKQNKTEKPLTFSGG